MNNDLKKKLKSECCIKTQKNKITFSKNSFMLHIGDSFSLFGVHQHAVTMHKIVHRVGVDKP